MWVIEDPAVIYVGYIPIFKKHTTEEICTTHVSDKSLELEYKKNSQNSRERKWAKGMNTHFTKCQIST